MEVADASTASGANVQQYAYNGNACQHWNLEEVADTGVKLDTTKVYQFQNSNSSLMLEVANAALRLGQMYSSTPKTATTVRSGRSRNLVTAITTSCPS